MNEQSIYAVIVTAVTVLGSTSAWRYYEKREQRKKETEDFIKNDCRDRISRLEALLERSSTEKEEMRTTILRLTEEVSALMVKVEYLDKENKELRKQLDKKGSN
jgi:hypothetical protein